MAANGTTRKTQAQRRAESRQAVLDAATRLFGEKGYADTSLEEIAADCGLTIRPIYHYFGNKKALFAAVNEAMEQRIIDAMDVGGERPLAQNWARFLDLCEDPGFRRVVLVDSPNVLGRERWADSAVTRAAQSTIAAIGGSDDDVLNRFRAGLLSRVLMAALAETALVIAEAEDIEMARREAEGLIKRLFSNLQA